MWKILQGILLTSVPSTIYVNPSRKHVYQFVTNRSPQLTLCYTTGFTRKPIPRFDNLALKGFERELGLTISRSSILKHHLTRRLLYFLTIGLSIDGACELDPKYDCTRVLRDRPRCQDFKLTWEHIRHSCLHPRVAGRFCKSFRLNENECHFERVDLMKLNESECFVKYYWILRRLLYTRACARVRMTLINERKSVYRTRGRKDVISITTQVCTCGLHNFCLFRGAIIRPSRRIIRHIYVFPYMRKIASYYRLRRVVWWLDK